MNDLSSQQIHASVLCVALLSLAHGFTADLPVFASLFPGRAAPAAGVLGLDLLACGNKRLPRCVTRIPVAFSRTTSSSAY